MAAAQTALNIPTCIVMVGLPARGKTFISKKLARYLNWIGVATKVFNVGEYRREIYGTVSCKHNFFDMQNEEGQSARNKCAELALNELIDFLMSGGQVAVFDATNTTQDRRSFVFEKCKDKGIKTLFIESICDDPDVIFQNIKEVKLSSPDYKNIPPDEARSDFEARIKHYADFYVPINVEEEGHLSFIKVINVGRKFLVNKIEGYLQTRAIYFLMNIHITPRAIYMTRHGESELNVAGKIGGDSNLSPRGQLYAEKLAQFIKEQDIKDLKVWTSQLKRTRQTARHFGVPSEQWRALDELDAGVCDSMTYDDIERTYPEDFRRRDEDKYHYRYMRGESYEDLVNRLEPVIMELERQENVLVVCHQAVMRCLLAYFRNIAAEDLPYIKVPLHTIIKLTPIAYGCKVEMFPLDVPSVCTHRLKPIGTHIDSEEKEPTSNGNSH